MNNVLLSSVVLGPYVLGLTLFTALSPASARDGGSPEGAPLFEDRAFALDGVDDVEIDLIAGDLTLRGGAAGQVAVRVLEAKTSPSCNLDIGLDGRTVRIQSRHEGLGGRCSFDLEIVVPGTLPVEIDLGAGDVTLDGLGGDLELDLGAGDVEGTAGGGRLEVSTGAGDIALSQLIGVVEAKTGTGGISLSFDAAPRGNIEATTGVGDVSVRLPADAVVQASASTGLGSVHRSLSERDGAETVVHASTGVGDVTLGSR